MTTELTVLAWGCILALVHIFVAVRFKTRQYGTKWNVGARDEDLPPPSPIVGRLARAQANFLETFPIFAAAALVVGVAGLDDRWTAIGAWLWLGARIVYLPLYAWACRWSGRSPSWSASSAYCSCSGRPSPRPSADRQNRQGFSRFWRGGAGTSRISAMIPSPQRIATPP